MSKSSGGGGASGTVEYPDYIEEVQADWLAHTDKSGASHDAITYSVTDLLNTAMSANSPYYGETVIDPDSYLTNMTVQLAQQETLVENISEETDWASYLTAVVAKAYDGSTFPATDLLDTLSTGVTDALAELSTILAAAPITGAVTAYETSVETRFLKSVSRWASSLADVNAVQTTTYGMGLAILESELNHDINQFESKLHLQIFNDLLPNLILKYVEGELMAKQYSNAFIAQAIPMIGKLFEQKLNGYADLTRMTAEINRISLVAKGEEQKLQIELEVRDALWDLELFKYGSPVMAAAPGGVSETGQTPLTAGQSALGGALAGASIGAATGNPWAALAGAGIGALLGYYS